MTTTKNPGGKGTVTPYVSVRGADAWLDFVEFTFETEKSFRVPNPDGTIGHAEITVGDSVLMAFDAKPEWPATYDVDPASLPELFADPAEAAAMKVLQDSFDAEMRSRV